MKTMHIMAAATAAGALAALAATPAAAVDKTVHFNFAAAGINVVGTLEVNPIANSNGQFLIDSVTGNESTSGGSVFELTGVSGYASADNLVTSSDPFVDFDGISFSELGVAGPANGLMAAINIFLAGSSDPREALLSSSENTSGFPDGLHPGVISGDFTTTVPEPATWAMMLTGFGGLGAMLRRRRANFTFA